MADKVRFEEYTHENAGTALAYGNDKWWIFIKNHKPAGDGFFQMGRHFKTDEIFVLLKGKAYLVTSIQDKDTKKHEFQIDEMKPDIVYNMPKNVWHYIIT